MTHLSQEFLVVLQTVFPAFLLILLLSAFIERSDRANSSSSDESTGIVPVIIPVFRVRSRLTSVLLALLTLTFVLSLSLYLIYYHGQPPVLAVWFSSSNLVVWGTAASLVWIRQNKTAGEFVWAKALCWVGLIGTVLIGSERISQFVQDTKDPQTTFPLPFFLLLSIYSVRLLLLILILWALHNPAQDFVPAVRRSTTNVSAHASNEENAPLLNQGRDHNGVEERGVQEEGTSYGTFTDVPESESTLDLERKKSAETSANDLAGTDAESDKSNVTTQPISTAVEIDEQALSKQSIASKVTNDSAQTTSTIEETTASPSSRPFSYAEAVTHPAPPGPQAGEEIENVSDSMDTTDTTAPQERFASKSTVASSLPKDSSVGPSVKSDLEFPTSTSPVSSDLPSQQFEDSPQLSTDSTDFSPNGGGKEKSKKKGTMLADVGRRVSNESNKFVRRISLINKTKSGSSPGGSANASPSRSPLSLPQELDAIELSGSDTAQGEEAGSGSTPGSPIAKRFALLTRKSSSASSTGRIPPGLQDESIQGLTSPALHEATGQAPSPNGSISGSGSGSGSKKKKKKNGKNSKGKKATKNKK
ncbi:hypothetical protein [Phaffia rhodozyma]|uniref:Uncharacterized protein n=1 Tax=Phaffia rhodozyma TaxID=264483 RepID=A0A0F7SPT2_PHARH|nr:hypothetical protein [Phaffia rhodozyma]